MWMRYDQFAKVLYDKLLALAGQVATQFEIAGEVQAADIWFCPAPDREAARARLGVLGRMAETPCLIEVFHGTPSVDAVRACVNKQLTLHRNLQRAAARPGHAEQDPPPVPRLWILSSGRPRQVMDALVCAPMTEAGWPDGFWVAAAPGFPVHLVVLRDLPARRDTLLLRLLGTGKTLLQAIHELHALPSDAWEAELAIPLLLAFRVDISQTDEEDAMNQANELQVIYEEWEKRVVHTAWKKGEEAGEEKGRLQNLRENLRLVYQARFGALPPEVQAAIESTKDIHILASWVPPFATGTPAQIAALVRAPRAR